MNIPRSRLFSIGIRQLARGGRTGNPTSAAIGFAMAAVGFLRAQRKPREELLLTETLKPGQGLTIRLLRGDEIVAETEVEA